MISTLQSVVTKAQRGKYAVGAFNVSDLEQIQAVIWAAEKLKSPVIINTTEKAIAYAGSKVLSGIVHTLAKQVRVPVVLNLDHGRDVAIAKQCIREGWTGIMFDGSTLPYEQNIKKTLSVALAGKVKGVGVEGELGRVKYPDEREKDPEVEKTDVDQALDFVRRTKICAFAVAIGNTHGLPVKDERLDFALLKKIQHHLSVPLVLHGASGTPPADIRKAITLGICKINIDTDLRLAFTEALRTVLAEQKKLYDPRAILEVGRAAVQAEVEKHIRLFGSAGKA